LKTTAVFTGLPEKKHVEHARHRLECAASESVARSVKPRQRAAYEAEVASLTAAIRDYVL
jgi:hypothetical protein